MMEELQRATPDAVTGSEGRTVDLRLVAWGDVATNTDEGYA